MGFVCFNKKMSEFYSDDITISADIICNMLTQVIFMNINIVICELFI